MTPVYKCYEKVLFEAKNNVNKPYFKNVDSVIQSGQYKGCTYHYLWLHSPEQIEWQILNHDLLIDINEFEKKSPRDKKYEWSDQVKAILEQYDELIEFNRAKSIIRDEWYKRQESKLPLIADRPQFTEDFRNTLIGILNKRNGEEDIAKIIVVLDLLGISMVNVESTIANFENNPFNNYGKSFFDFLYACVNYGCGEYYHKCSLPLEKETLLKIKSGEVKEFVIPYKTLNSIPAYQKQIITIEEKRYFLKNTDCNAKKEGIKYGKVYCVLEYNEPLIAYNWFNFKSSIEARVDILLSVDCVNRLVSAY